MMNTLRNLIKHINVILLSIILVPGSGFTCTTFNLHTDGQIVFGKNYDWHLGRGLLIVNKRGVVKQAMPGTHADPGRYATWTSKYGSLTFNQYGREMPMGGINEAGLVVELMMLSETQYPIPDDRHAIKDLQWIQYQLDNFSRVAEVISSDTDLRILTFEQPGLHFLVADMTGDCATIEFLNEKLIVHHQDSLMVRTLTNSTYTESCNYLKKHEGFGGQVSITTGPTSLNRFVNSAKMLKEYDAQKHASAVDYAFRILEQVSQESTQWRIVYDQKKLQVHFRTASNPTIKSVDLKGLDFDCETPVMVVDIDADLSGNINKSFVEYSRAVNLDLIRYAFKNTGFMRYLPDRFIHQRADYPDTTACNK